MIELSIDGMHLDLPAGFKIEYIRENTYLTKDGSYSLDIEIPINTVQNAKVYSHISRLNNTPLIENRRAILIVNNKIILDGLERIIGFGDKSAHIQLLAGNSELNVVGGKTKIWELNIGVIPTPTMTQALNSLESGYPTFDYVCPPIKIGDVLYNNFDYGTKTNEPFRWTIPQITNICPQPYSAFIFDKIIEALGYDFIENDYSEDVRYKKDYLTNPLTTGNYSDILPDWTVNEYFSEIENKWGANIIIDDLSKLVRLKKSKDYSILNRTTVNNILDIYSVEVDPTKSINKASYDWVNYDFPETEFYKMLCLPENIMSLYENQIYHEFDIFESETLDYGRMWEFNYYFSHNDWTDAARKRIAKLFHGDKHYIFRNYDYQYINAGAEYTISKSASTLCHQFRGIGTNKLGNIITLKIIPAKMEKNEFWIRPGNGVSARYYCAQDIPVIDKIEIISTSSSVIDAIKNGIQTQTRPSTMVVCLYMGYHFIRQRDTGAIVTVDGATTYTPLWPYSQIDLYFSFVDGLTLCPKHSYSSDDDKLTLATFGTTGMYETYYKSTLNIDFTKKYKLIYIAENEENIDPKNIFIFKNKEFICDNLQFEFVAGTTNKLVTGYFYPIL